MGAAVWFLPVSRTVERHPEEILTAALVVLAATLLACHSALGSLAVVWRDYLIGGVFAAVVWVILHLQGEPNQDGVASRAAKLLAGQSYTLYVVHVPLLVFLRAALGGPLQWQLSPATVAMAAGLAVLCLVYSYGIAQLTEARTELVRQRLRRWIVPVAPTAAVGIAGGGEGPA
jgi:peptidoglycan/LPS O-acetylase OafA/YrhL